MGEIKNTQGASAEQVEAALMAYHEGGDFPWHRMIELFPGEVGGERDAMQAALSAAQAIEGRQGGDAEGGSVEDESAVTEGDVPQPPSFTPGEVDRLVERLVQAAINRGAADEPGEVSWTSELEREVIAARTALLSHISTAGRGAGAGELARLSDLATQGEWRPDVHVYYDEDGGPPEDSTEGVMVLDYDDRPDSIIQCSEDDARFVVALVNAYRSGRLVERSAADATNPQDQE